MIKIGLTGGIGSGKSTVCRLFTEQGVAIIDADLISRELVEPGQPALQQLVAAFGPGILDNNGILIRSKLRELVFSDIIKKKQLESILHPLVYNCISERAAALKGHYCIVAVPLLLETGKAAGFDRIAVVDCSVEQQIQRVSNRDGLQRQEILNIIASQVSREARLKQADDVIDNTTTTVQLAEQIKRLHNSYILLASVRTSSA